MHTGAINVKIFCENQEFVVLSNIMIRRDREEFLWLSRYLHKLFRDWIKLKTILYQKDEVSRINNFDQLL